MGLHDVQIVFKLLCYVSLSHWKATGHFNGTDKANKELSCLFSKSSGAEWRFLQCPEVGSSRRCVGSISSYLDTSPTPRFRVMAQNPVCHILSPVLYIWTCFGFAWETFGNKSD